MVVLRIVENLHLVVLKKVGNGNAVHTNQPHYPLPNAPAVLSINCSAEFFYCKSDKFFIAYFYSQTSH